MPYIKKRDESWFCCSVTIWGVWLYQFYQIYLDFSESCTEHTTRATPNNTQQNTATKTRGSLACLFLAQSESPLRWLSFDPALTETKATPASAPRPIASHAHLHGALQQLHVVERCCVLVPSSRCSTPVFRTNSEGIESRKPTRFAALLQKRWPRGRTGRAFLSMAAEDVAVEDGGLVGDRKGSRGTETRGCRRKSSRGGQKSEAQRVVKKRTGEQTYAMK